MMHLPSPAGHLRPACAFVTPTAPLFPLHPPKSFYGAAVRSPWRPCLQRPPRRPALRVAPVALADPNFVHSASGLDLHAVGLWLAQAAATVSDGAAAVGEAAAEAKKSGLWENFVYFIECAIQVVHTALERVGIPYGYGFSIILFTFGVKALTFPLNASQMESTIKMQALSPRLKEIQRDYKDNPQVMNQMIAQLYKDEKVNPLLGCVPVLIQLPVWVGLYRAVLNLAESNILDESFLWIPSLQGPVSKTGQGLSTWLYPFVDGAPPIGWHDALAYMVIPVLLVIIQIYSQKLLQPPTQDPAAANANMFLKFLPVLFGWFALNVPSGLCVYWITNSLLSTAQTLYIRKQYGSPAVSVGTAGSLGGASGDGDADHPSSADGRMSDRAAGFDVASSNGGPPKRTTPGIPSTKKAASGPTRRLKKRKKRRK